MDIKELIIDKSKELNIDMIGFTNSEPLLDLEEYLNYRRENNVTTEFEEKDIQRRIYPKLTMPSCKSIIVIGMSYNVDSPHQCNEVGEISPRYKEKAEFEFKGSLSKSSWGIDYHRVLKSKLDKLIEEIQKNCDFEYKSFVDTGPLIDRELANRAGIGYYGKNCNIINDEYGSFIFIGYILTNLDIKVNNNSLTSKCGDCNLCIRACPTDALEEPFRLNPKRCISYLTQTKDEIDPELKKKMGIKIYGCDTCQMVCPKNKGAKKSVHQEFIPEITKGSIDIKELLSMSNREFKLKYGHMAGSWRGKTILKRNAINALNNIRNKDNDKRINELLENK